MGGEEVGKVTWYLILIVIEKIEPVRCGTKIFPVRYWGEEGF